MLYQVKIQQGSGAIMGERPGGSIRDHGQDPPPPVLHPVTKVFDKNDDEDLWIRISL